MTSTPFVYSSSRLEECAASKIVTLVMIQDLNDSRNDTTSPTVSTLFAAPAYKDNEPKADGNSCIVLWNEYKRHYATIFGNDKDNEPDNEISSFSRFLRSVFFVNKHNNDPKVSHQVTLNRFSAMETRHLFSQVEYDTMHQRTLLVEEEVVDAPNLGIGHGAKHALHKHHSKRYNNAKEVTVKELRVPDASREPFQTPEISSPLDGFLLDIKRRRLDPDENITAGDAVPSTDKYKTLLNWATEDNPDGVVIVHDAFDQLSCGSCWAFAAAGSLEASASRRAAFFAYETFRTSQRERWKVNQTVQEEAVMIAQNVQRRSMEVLNLSVQELLDCDSITDQGCVGGNPLLAFYYIHQNGLVSWEDYPYQAKAGSCLENATQNPVATVKSWGIIQSDHEKHMELSLRYIGPIAVGINGDNSEFLAYSGGIFDSPRCKQVANHALLIVGYGQEESPTGDILRYWIARNSWGTGWGENGYVRIKRGAGHAGIKGVCGVARNPSVALGGMLLRETAYVFNESGLQQPSSFDMESLCSHLGFNVSTSNSCTETSNWVGGHKALTLGIIGVLCGLVLLWPLSLDIRRRREHRRLKKIRREERRRNSSRQLLPSEDTPLLARSAVEAT